MSPHNKDHVLPGHDITPRDCLIFADTSYKKDKASQNAFLRRQGVDGQVVKSKIYKNWRISLIKLPSNLHVVSFEGTTMTSTGNWVDNVLHHVHHIFYKNVYCDTIEFHENTIRNWKKKIPNLKIVLFTGHSAGGCFATHTLKNECIPRVTFNAHLALSGPFHTNFSTTSDPVSKYLGGKGQYIPIGSGGHGLSDFYPHIRQEHKWEDFSNFKNSVSYSNKSLKEDIFLLKETIKRFEKQLKKNKDKISNLRASEIFLKLEIGRMKQNLGEVNLETTIQVHRARLSTLAKADEDHITATNSSLETTLEVAYKHLFNIHDRRSSYDLYSKSPEHFSIQLNRKPENRDKIPNAYLLKKLFQVTAKVVRERLSEENYKLLRGFHKELFYSYEMLRTLKPDVLTSIHEYISAYSELKQTLHDEVAELDHVPLVRYDVEKEKRIIKTLLDPKVFVGEKKFQLQQLVHQNIDFSSEFKKVCTKLIEISTLDANAADLEILKLSLFFGALSLMAGPAASLLAMSGHFYVHKKALIYILNKQMEIYKLEMRAEVDKFSRAINVSSQELASCVFKHKFTPVRKITVELNGNIENLEVRTLQVTQSVFYSCLTKNLKINKSKIKAQVLSSEFDFVKSIDTNENTNSCEVELLAYKVHIFCTCGRIDDYSTRELVIDESKSYLTYRDLNNIPPIRINRRTYKDEKRKLLQDLKYLLHEGKAEADSVFEMFNLSNYKGDTHLIVPSLCSKSPGTIIPNPNYEMVKQSINEVRKLTKIISPKDKFEIGFTFTKSSGLYKLSLIAYLQKENSLEKLEYKALTLAKIGSQVVESTNKIEFSEHNYKFLKPNIQESFLELLYTNLLPTLGVPKNTYQLEKKGMITGDHDTSFEGIISFLTRNPNKGIEYLSNSNNPVTKYDLAVQDGKDKAAVDCYLKNKKEIFLKNNPQYLQLTENYHRLLTFSKLFYDVTDDRIGRILNQFQISTPKASFTLHAGNTSINTAGIKEQIESSGRSRLIEKIDQLDLKIRRVLLINCGLFFSY